MGLFSKQESAVHPERKVSPTKSILLIFLVIILIGAFLLMLPISSANSCYTSFVTALFTSTSATCVTGLTVVDTLSYWSRFGQIVILLLIQCGGLGFMAFATVFSLVLHRRISLRERLIMTQAFSINEISGIVRLTQHILLRTFLFEGIGALLLATRFIPEYGFGEGLFKSVFHSVSAFCNAGFDIIGVSSEHIGSFSKYIADPVVCLTVISLMILGGLGFFVWEDVLNRQSVRSFSLHTKLVLITTSVLILSGTALFLLFEYGNENTIGSLPFWQKLMAALFQSSTTRTAGFFTISQQGMTTSSKVLSTFLMFIGGSPGSTAGGIKTVTLAVLVLTAFSVMRGRAEVTAFERRIPPQTVFKAVTVMIVAAFLTAVVAIIIALTNNINMINAMFESVSAFSTTGISTGITASLNTFSQITLILLMYFGRVGLLTLSIALVAKRKPSKISYTEGKLIIG